MAKISGFFRGLIVMVQDWQVVKSEIAGLREDIDRIDKDVRMLLQHVLARRKDDTR